jgi:hypothetical protein
MDSGPTIRPERRAAAAELRRRPHTRDGGAAAAETHRIPRPDAGGRVIRARILRRRKRLRALLRRLEAALAEQSPTFRRLRGVLAELDALDRLLAQPHAADPAVLPAPLRQTDAAETVLRRSGTPLSIGELLLLVREQGARVGGVRPRSTLASALSQDPRFVAFAQEGGYRWWLASVPRPDAGHGSLGGRSEQDP